MTDRASSAPTAQAAKTILVPLVLAQFICSFAGSNMNVMIGDISKDLGTGVEGVQTAITLFLLIMAALMIPCGKLTDRYGRVRLLKLGLACFGIGALIASAAQGQIMLVIGYSMFEGVGTALLIPPVYILATLMFTDVTSRARAFGMIMAAGGVGAVAGPLIGGLITSAISWRASFVFQALIIVAILWLSRKVEDPIAGDPTRPFDLGGAILSAAGLILVVTGILAAQNNLWLMLGLLVAGALVLVWFFLWIRAKERAHKEPLLSTSLFRNRTSNLGLVTQNAQWLLLMGTSFTVATYLQVVRGYSAIDTGLIFTAATIGVLVTSLAQPRFAKRRDQRTLVIAGFIMAIVGVVVLLALANGSPSPWASTPGLFLYGLGVGAMLTPSVNIVQSAFPEARQGEISGLSRSVSNLGSSLGTAIAGTILVANLTHGSYAVAMGALVVAALGGLAAAFMLPRHSAPTVPTPAAPEPSPAGRT
jgi:MFS family permease